METIKKRVYLAGKMRGVKDFNFPVFDKAKELGINLGFFVISPADMDRADNSNFTEEEKKRGIHNISFEEQQKLQRKYAERDLAAVFDVDYVAVLPGWEHSIGAVAEVAVARWLMLEILDATTFKPLQLKKEIFKEKETT